MINSSNLAANNNFVTGLQTENKIILGGGNDINKISVKNKKGSGHLTGVALTSAGASLGAKSLLVEVVDEASVSRDGNSTTMAQGITHAGGTLTVEDLTVNVTSKGRYNSGILGTAGTAEIGRLKLKVVAGDSESEADSAKAYGLWMEPARGLSPGQYSLSARSMDIEASSLQGGEAYGLYMEMNEENSAHEVKVSSGATSIRIAKAGAATGVDMVGLESNLSLVKAELGTLAMNVQGDEKSVGIDALASTVVVNDLSGEIRAENGEAQGIVSRKGAFTANGSLTLAVSGNTADGLVIGNGTRADFNGKVDLDVTAASGIAQGIDVDHGSKATFKEHVDVAVTAMPADKLPNQLYGVDVDSGSEAVFQKGLKVATSGSAKTQYHAALNAKSGKIVVEGGADIAAQDGYWSLMATEGGSITISQDASATTTVIGDVSSSGAESVINVALNAGDSLSARSFTENGGAFNLGLKDGAVWNVGAGGASAATKVASDAGHLAFSDTGSSLNVDTLELTNTTVVSMNDMPAGGGHYITAGSITGHGIVRVEGTADMNDARTGSTSEVVNSTADAVFGEAGLDKVGEVYLAEGKLFGEVEAVLNENGTYDIAERTNTKLEAANTLAVLAAMQWRHEMNDLTKRMGELRTSPEGIGSWVRLYGSEQAYGGIEAKNTSVQVGADVDAGAGWKVGAAFSYTDGSADIANGSADSKAYGIAAYGTWMDASGQFVDLIAKYGKLDTDYKVKGVSGSFDNDAWSVSAEYGRHFKLADIAFVEPQAEVTYGQVMGDDAVNGDGVRLEQEDFESLIGRVGVRTGFYFPNNKGVVYARASVLHDFKGEAETVARLNGRSVSFRDDVGGTWGELGIGANFNLTDATYAYVDLEKTAGGDVSEKWRWNAGLRHVF